MAEIVPFLDILADLKFSAARETQTVDQIVALMDNKTVITGSFHCCPSVANTHELTLRIIETPKLAGHFTREINRLRRGA